jgi:PBP1b-binding outer membrane lipoprotein LpoB
MQTFLLYCFSNLMKHMKKILPFLCVALLMLGCEPVGTTTTAGADTTKVDTTAVAVQETLPTPDPLPVDSGAIADAGTTVDPNGKPANPDATPGKQANPNANLGGKRFVVTGHVVVTSPYCGGAAPTQEMIDKAKTAQPMANQGFLIRNGSTNALGTALVTRTRTDAKGDFKLDLAPGTYCMVLEEKENRRTNDFYNTMGYEVDRKADDKWLGKCELSFTVADKPVSGLRLAFTRKCMINSFSPAISWNGPLPSSPAPRGK